MIKEYWSQHLDKVILAKKDARRRKIVGRFKTWFVYSILSGMKKIKKEKFKNYNTFIEYDKVCTLCINW